ncbi:hypothetical protein DEU56DRAFT_901464 [Suillus clintonianus]|uniref:uncharacterized protein n=1 Tax=Suillus clintonianus TaxID=1904413 RepID=UPI001B86EF91|nr:uncharacterized protein DEU56DRAFT_901464 [Suillus clintonianus]KAG2137020.1 hypothetical protein DEU56DRAFT_901464 [Suillus clintonianus]
MNIDQPQDLITSKQCSDREQTTMMMDVQGGDEPGLGGLSLQDQLLMREFSHQGYASQIAAESLNRLMEELDVNSGFDRVELIRSGLGHSHFITDAAEGPGVSKGGSSLQLSQFTELFYEDPDCKKKGEDLPYCETVTEVDGVCPRAEAESREEEFSCRGRLLRERRFLLLVVFGGIGVGAFVASESGGGGGGGGDPGAELEKIPFSPQDAYSGSAFHAVFEHGPAIELDSYVVHHAHFEHGRLLA